MLCSSKENGSVQANDLDSITYPEGEGFKNMNVVFAPNYLTVEEASKLICQKPRWVYEMVRKGLIPHYRFGRNIRFEKSELLAWAQKQRRGPRIKIS